ncbi:hypothetical protein NE237_026515 [Protea cynaroides]|uniref:Transmembrane 9 superfamily member n=1 Tax=Protea cynaroides TaxID=273540 RepID=A0A9Q0K0K3_9MAGN|nr:hypothetical protein NE237_026515 [Protea cynaroides]
METRERLVMMRCFHQFWVCALFSCLTLKSGDGFYFPGNVPPKYSVGDGLSVKVNTLTSIDKEMTFSYSSLPFCKSPEGLKYGKNKFRVGDEIQNSPYNFQMYTNDTSTFLCQTDPLSADDTRILTKSIDEGYQGRFYIVFNHLRFKFLVHKYEENNVPRYMVVGFEVFPCSFDHDPDSVKNLKMYEKYASPVYLNMNDSKTHWFSILESVIMIIFLAVIMLVGFFLSIRKDLTRYEELDQETRAAARMNDERWKLRMGEVFRAPDHPALLYMMVGDGIQILGMAVLTIMLAALNFMSPAYRGTLLACMLFSYMILGSAAGYVAFGGRLDVVNLMITQDGFQSH